VKVDIYTGEAYPINYVYAASVRMFHPPAVDVDVETLNRWKFVFDAFTQVQDEITDVLKSQHPELWGQYINEENESWNGFDYYVFGEDDEEY
jgi:hypothetical protein